MADNTSLPVPAWFDAREILTKYISGQRTDAIAAELGVNRELLAYHLLTKATEDWKEAQVIRDLRRKEEAEDAIDNAKDLLELTRAEKKLKSAQWSLERVCRRIYGDTSPKEPGEGVSIVLNIGISRPGDEAKVIEQESSPDR